ncbi:hypothetical protein ACFLW2_00680 [Chloroflexota bacterium]
MSPQIVQNVVDWIFGRRSKNNKYYGNRDMWSIPGYGSSGRRRANDRILPDKSGEADMGRGPVGQKQKVIDFDDGSSIDEGAADQEWEGIGGGFDMIEEEEAVAEQRGSGIIDESYMGEWSVDEKLPDIDSEPGMKEEKAAKQKVPGIGDKSYVDEVTGIRVLRFNDTSPAKETEAAEAAEQILSDINDNTSLAEEITPDQIINIPVTEEQTLIPEVLEVSEVTDYTSELPMSQEIYKEEDMSDAYYVARDNSESGLVKQLHPDCSVMIPADYDGAIDEIKTCPLDCPYKALELAEVDQKGLRSRFFK